MKNENKCVENKQQKHYISISNASKQAMQASNAKQCVENKQQKHYNDKRWQHETKNATQRQ